LQLNNADKKPAILRWRAFIFASIRLLDYYQP
jgi:hypothetical protein